MSNPEIETYTIVSSKNELKSFKESFIWKDILNELNAVKLRAVNELVQTAGRCIDGTYDLSKTISNLGLAVGVIKSVDDLINIPNELIRTIEEFNLIQKRSKKEESDD